MAVRGWFADGTDSGCVRIAPVTGGRHVVSGFAEQGFLCELDADRRFFPCFPMRMGGKSCTYRSVRFRCPAAGGAVWRCCPSGRKKAERRGGDLPERSSPRSDQFFQAGGDDAPDTDFLPFGGTDGGKAGVFGEERKWALLQAADDDFPVDDGQHDMPVLRRDRPVGDDGVPLHDPDAVHRVALYAEQK